MPFHPLPDESSRAYATFVVYRDLGRDRSLSQAYRLAYLKGDSFKGPTPGYMSDWAVKYQWANRALQWDAHLDGESQKQRIVSLRKLTERRVDAEIEEQEDVEQAKRDLQYFIQKAKKAPIVGVDTKEEIEATPGTEAKPGIEATPGTPASTRFTKVKGISLSGIASVFKLRNETAAQAITGVRPQPKAAESEPQFQPGEIARLENLNDAELADLLRLRRRLVERAAERGGNPRDAAAEKPEQDSDVLPG